MASIKPKTSFAPWRAHTRIASVVDHRSCIAVLVLPCSIVGRGSPCWIVGRGSRIRGLCSVVLGCGWLLRMVWYGVGFGDEETGMRGSALWCWDAGGYCGWHDMLLGCGCWVRRWRDRDERQGREMRDRGERVR